MVPGNQGNTVCLTSRLLSPQGNGLRLHLLRVFFTSFLNDLVNDRDHAGRDLLRRRSRRIIEPLLPRDDPFSRIENDKLAVALGEQGVTLDRIQDRLNNCKLSALVVRVVKRSPTDGVFLEAIKLAVALLHGGNRKVQVRLTDMVAMVTA